MITVGTGWPLLDRGLVKEASLHECNNHAINTMRNPLHLTLPLEVYIFHQLIISQGLWFPRKHCFNICYNWEKNFSKKRVVQFHITNLPMTTLCPSVLFETWYVFGHSFKTSFFLLQKEELNKYYFSHFIFFQDINHLRRGQVNLVSIFFWKNIFQKSFEADSWIFNVTCEQTVGTQATSTIQKVIFPGTHLIEYWIHLNVYSTCVRDMKGCLLVCLSRNSFGFISGYRDHWCFCFAYTLQSF